MVNEKADSGKGKSKPSPPSGVRRVDVRTLLEGQREVLLDHEGQTYHLRITANGKLILTK